MGQGAAQDRRIQAHEDRGYWRRWTFEEGVYQGASGVDGCVLLLFSLGSPIYLLRTSAIVAARVLILRTSHFSCRVCSVVGGSRRKRTRREQDATRPTPLSPSRSLALSLLSSHPRDGLIVAHSSHSLSSTTKTTRNPPPMTAFRSVPLSPPSLDPYVPGSLSSSLQCFPTTLQPPSTLVRPRMASPLLIHLPTSPPTSTTPALPSPELGRPLTVSELVSSLLTSLGGQDWANTNGLGEVDEWGWGLRGWEVEELREDEETEEREEWDGELDEREGRRGELDADVPPSSACSGRSLQTCFLRA